MSLKQKIYDQYLQLLNERIGLLQKVLDDLKESGSNETKSTAGDKHETALAMLQIEQAQKREQLHEALLQKTQLEKINPGIISSAVVNGSLVKTNRGYFFLSVALGKIIVDGLTIIALSPQSPLGMKLPGLKTGDQIQVNGNDIIIEKII